MPVAAGVVLALEAIVTAVLRMYVDEPTLLAIGLTLVACTAIGLPTLVAMRASYRERLQKESARADSAKVAAEEAMKAGAVRERGLEVLHKATEAVRMVALNKEFTAQQLSDTIRPLLETRLLLYLARRLPGHEFSVTVKWIQGTEIVSVFRDSMQGPSRPQGEKEQLQGHYFHERFAQEVHKMNDLRCLVVHETERSEVPPALQTRAKKRGYRCCLALPLNLPESDRLFANVGFLSIDAPQPNAFCDMFERRDISRELGNDGENHRAKPDMHLLYGLADAIATIIALAEKKGGSN